MPDAAEIASASRARWVSSVSSSEVCRRRFAAASASFAGDANHVGSSDSTTFDIIDGFDDALVAHVALQIAQKLGGDVGVWQQAKAEGEEGQA